jgi:alpha-glucosidase
MTEWDAAAIREVISESLRAFPAVGAPATWVLSNHDVVRHASRLALTAENPQGHGIGPDSPGQPIPEVGLRRARAATTVMLALPGSAYLYQGEEPGLPEVIALPPASRQDPTWFRTDGERYGRDGAACRSRGPRMPPPTASARRASRGCRSRPNGPRSPATRRRRPRLDAVAVPHAAGDPPRRGPRSGDAGVARRLRRRRDRVPVRSVTVIANVGRAGDAAVGTVLVASEPFDGTELPVDVAVWMVAD